jgi:Na+/alanine symporter
VQDQATDAVVAGIAHKVAQGGTGVVLWGWLTANDVAAFGGLLLAVIGVCIQWYYRRRQDRRDAELHAAKLADIREHGEHE